MRNFNKNIAMLLVMAFFFIVKGDVFMWEISPMARVVGDHDVNSAYVFATSGGFNNVEGESLVVPDEEPLPDVLEGVVPEPSAGLLVTVGIGFVMLRRRRSV